MSSYRKNYRQRPKHDIQPPHNFLRYNFQHAGERWGSTTTTTGIIHDLDSVPRTDRRRAYAEPEEHTSPHLSTWKLTAARALHAGHLRYVRDRLLATAISSGQRSQEDCKPSCLLRLSRDPASTARQASNAAQAWRRGTA